MYYWFYDFAYCALEIIYVKMYENGANPFYLPSQAELDTQTIIENQQKEAAAERVNVDF